MAALGDLARPLVFSIGALIVSLYLEAALLGGSAYGETRSPEQLPTVVLRPASELAFPAEADCNSPAHWKGDTFFLFNSRGWPRRSTGPDLFHLGSLIDCPYDNPDAGYRWLECTSQTDDGTLFGWYHLEPSGICPEVSNKRMAKGEPPLTAPKIGAVVSHDDGATWKDLGIILEAPADSINCATANKFFAGGHGDFSAMLDADKEYVYFFIGSYYGSRKEQGVAVARMKFADRHQPVGKVWKWFQGKWDAPGIGGRVTPVFSAQTDWHREDANAFWGPSIHWNTHLDTYVILLNRTKDASWTQEGIYVTFHSDLADPGGWTAPRKILDGGTWYPQVIGLEKGGTDKLAGRVARFFMGGKSNHEIVFLQPDEKPDGK
jgi:hypothetical protein